ncbi:MAG: radical SAM protein [Candidatus Omnitrophica bacterium]|nr:radical SAM protein [Candidatus Omnitrophota bacterium]
MSLSRLRKFKYIYGPVSSWRLGRSLGVDLLSRNKKVCTFDCVYCQIGANPEMTTEREPYVAAGELLDEIKNLPRNLKIDYITFSGKGEPTLAGNLGGIIKKTKQIRREKIAVITNSSLMKCSAVRKDLSLADVVIAKIDAFSQKSFEKINKPVAGLRFKDVYNGIKEFRKHYKGKLAIQIMFFDANKDDFKKIARLVYDIRPDEIEINTPTRRSPIKPLSKSDIAKITKYFRAFGKKAGLKTRVISLYESERKDVTAINKEATIRRRGAMV